MWSSPPFSYSCSCALTSMKYTTSKKTSMEWCWRLVSLPSAPMSSESVLSLTPVQKVAPYCLVPSTASSQVQNMAHFSPSLCGLCQQNQDPESLGTGISPWLVDTIGKPFPDPMNFLPSTNPDPLVCPYPSWIHSESVCANYRKENSTRHV